MKTREKKAKEQTRKEAWIWDHELLEEFENRTKWRKGSVKLTSSISENY